MTEEEARREILRRHAEADGCRHGEKACFCCRAKRGSNIGVVPMAHHTPDHCGDSPCPYCPEAT